MITIAKLDTGTAQSYYRTDFSAASNRYYSQQQTLQGRWQGELARELGLNGGVTDEQFERLTNGQHPHTGEQLIKHRPESEKSMAHVAAWDLTFRPGKSISLAALRAVTIAWRKPFAMPTIKRWRPWRRMSSNAWAA